MLRLRLVIDDACPGSWNMAVDEALLEQAAAGGTATLRFYRWSEPTLSLGYFQTYQSREGHRPSRDCPIVRRASGGGALVHDRELTYSFTAPISDRAAADVEQLYYAFHETMVSTLDSFGIEAALVTTAAAVKPTKEPFLCFQRRTAGDLLVGGAKVLGSAQRRRKSAVLQHGGLLISKSASAPELDGISELAGKNTERLGCH